MKPRLFAFVQLCALSFALVCCVSSKTRAVSLFPSAELAWPAVEEDVARGIADGADDGDLSPEAVLMLTSQSDKLGGALKARDSGALREVSWTTLEFWANRGIGDKLDDGEIGPGVAQSLHEQLFNFSTTITRLQTTF